MRRGKLVRATLIAAVGLALLAPGLGHTDPTAYECSYFTCVKTNISSLKVSCFTTSNNRPNCTATALVSATAKRYLGTFDIRYYVEYLVHATGGSVMRLVPGSVPKMQKYEKTAYWGGDGPKTISGTVRAPAVSGPVGGCLKYQATFTIFGTAGNVYYLSSLGPLNMFDSVSSHTHTITGPNYCV